MLKKKIKMWRYTYNILINMNIIIQYISLIKMNNILCNKYISFTKYIYIFLFL